MRAALLTAALAGQACSGHYLQAMAPVHALARQGHPMEALAQLDARTKDTGWDPLLVALDEGALAHRGARFKRSSEALNRAIALADERETVSFTEEAFGRAPFRMSNVEKQALHALQAMNYLMMHRLDDAVVEARLTDLRQRKLAAETEESAANERAITGHSVDDGQRSYFEQLVFGCYVSALARELSGDADGAFIDYFKALTLMRGSPGARIQLEPLVPKLLAMAERLQRPELEQLKGWYPAAVAEPALGEDGEVVLLLEQGFVPVPRMVAQRGMIALMPQPRPRGAPMPVYADAAIAPAVVSSLEDLAMRRGYAGLLVDRERKASVAANVALLGVQLIFWPIGMPLLIRRAYESNIREQQAWVTLPAELAVARFRLPAGPHQVRVPTLRGFGWRTVEVKAGAMTLLTQEAP